jgi:hypothetical protein
VRNSRIQPLNATIWAFAHIETSWVAMSVFRKLVVKATIAVAAIASAIATKKMRSLLARIARSAGNFIVTPPVETGFMILRRSVAFTHRTGDFPRWPGL